MRTLDEIFIEAGWKPRPITGPPGSLAEWRQLFEESLPELRARAPESAEHGARKPGHQDSAARGQIAVATWQKSTARRLVSICAVGEVTNPMLCGLGRAVTVTVTPPAL